MFDIESANAHLFIDGPALYKTCRALEFDIDYRKLLQLMRMKAQIKTVSYYTISSPSDDHSPVKPLGDWLSYNGYKVVLREGRDMKTNDGQRYVKGSVHCDMSVDVIAAACLGKLDHAVLICSDSEYSRTFQVLRQNFIPITLISSLEAVKRGSYLSDQLRRGCDEFIDLIDLQKDISKLKDKTT